MKILKFGAVWCSGCLVMKPRFMEIEKEMPWLETIYYDYDQDKTMCNKWQINKILPVFIFLDRDGNELFRLSGEQSKKKLIGLIEKNKDK